MPTFILEIGVEEMPARVLENTERELKTFFTQRLEDAGYTDFVVSAFSTPRRALVKVENLSEYQPVREETVSGPPARIAYDANGNPTKAAEGFAKNLGISVTDLITVSTPKGEYLAGVRKSGGIPTQAVLQEISPSVMNNLSFPKKMHWGSLSALFIRPIRWIVALFGQDVVSFEYAGVTSGRSTCGHRVHGFGPFEAQNADMLENVINVQGHIVLSASERRASIIEGGNSLAQKQGGRVIWMDSLLDEVTGLSETPVPLLGNIDPVYLELPREVLLTSMQVHQKSFGIENSDGKILPYFLTVLNLHPEKEEVVRKGWERVLRARLEDARFFWKSDLEDTFDHWLEKLDNVIFLAPLGSMGDKSRRIAALCTALARELGMDEEKAARAGRLSKADLMSAMVNEFDTLQGIMGGIYAAYKGEAPEVAAAVSEQYLPAGPDTTVPTSDFGAILSIADKADTLAGCFGLDMMPTGTADPYALRRCALGIIRIMLDRGWSLNIADLFARARSLYGDRSWKLNESVALQKLMEFFEGRAKNHFLTLGFETLQVEAVLASGGSDIPSDVKRLKALKLFSESDTFEAAIQTFKRVENIIRKQGSGRFDLDGSIDVSLLQEPAERELANCLETFSEAYEQAFKMGDYDKTLTLLSELRPHVDALFENVMVMCEDQNLCRNRLNMLRKIALKMEQFADFSALQY
ncbi:MAG: glycine--tRNA ligase subunit beta [Desulfovibrionaceae bacterium]|nr:glycine--tRNA ligase subunit beta [Desulfovibrionaceae bacterium]